MSNTVKDYLNLKTPCTITPTFKYVRPFIVGKTLDIGTGTGEYLTMLPAKSIGIDASKENLSIVQEKGLEAAWADINQDLPFESDSFQTVFCSHTIEHVDSPLHLLREAYRILTHEGNIILALPLEKTIVRLFRDKYFKDHAGHLYGLSVECTERLLEYAGFGVIAKYYNFPIVNRLCFADKFLQKIAGYYCQSFCTMYWIVAGKKKTTQG